MSYSNGDIVKIVTTNSRHTGEQGTITNVYGDEESLLIKLDRGNELGYFVNEVELVKAYSDEEDQIDKLAHALVDEGGFPALAPALLTARSLYKAGVRFSG